jgi:hypothetical protein
VNCGPWSYFLYIAITCLLYSHCLFYSHTITIFHSIRSFLCLQQTGEIDNLIVSWERSIWLYCVQVPRCSWERKAWTRRLINCPELSQASKHHLQSFGFFPFGSINLGFLLRENLAAIFIIPSSWGSQLDGALHYQHRAASGTAAKIASNRLSSFTNTSTTLSTMRGE